MSRKLLLIGGGGHCRSILDVILSMGEFNEIGIVERKGAQTNEVLGIPVVGFDEDLHKLHAHGFTDAFIALGSIGNTTGREKLFKIALDEGFLIPNIVSPSAIISKNITLGRGIFIGNNAIINVGAKIDDCVIINTGAIIEHDCAIGSFTHIAPGVVLSGGVSVGQRTHIGAGSVIKQSVCIGQNAMIGMGSVVLDSIVDSTLAYGNPCKVIRKL
jgi:sugar O-acyltransferase (sialic acid O-acetyltransferase NeuD family)